MTFFLKPKNRYCECVSTHFISGVNQDSTTIFSKAPELSMNLRDYGIVALYSWL